MTRKLNANDKVRRFDGKQRKPVSFKYHQPFWLPASNYYILAAAAAIAFFFLFWGILHDDAMPWIPAGFGASLILIGAVLLREVILKNARNRYLAAQRKLDYNLETAAAALRSKTQNRISKLSLQENAKIIGRIRRKSEAAKILGKLPDAHREIFEMCDEYLILNANELKNVGVGSPRLGGLRRGKEIVGDLHRFHLFSWAEIESRVLMREAKNRATIGEKLETAQKVLAVLDTALQYYPNEAQFLESEKVINEFVVSTKVSHWIEQAERAAFKENFKRAISHYRDALFYLARGNVQNEQRQAVAEKINAEIAKLRAVSMKKANGENKLKRER